MKYFIPTLFTMTAILSAPALVHAADSASAPSSLESVLSGTGKAKFDALLQAWTVDSTANLNAIAPVNFRMRRAELRFSGTVAESSRWFVMIDPAKALQSGPVASSNDNRALQDLGVAFGLGGGLELIAGQFKTPTTAEGLDPSAELLLPERSYVARLFGDRREPGAELIWSDGIWKVTGMLSNGGGTNVDDTTSEKDATLRLDVAPTETLKLGAFTQAGDFSYGTKARWGANARLRIDELLLRVEGVHANDAGVVGNGYVAEATYHLTPSFEPVVRFDGFDNGTVSARAYAVGLNYYYAKHGAKVQAAYWGLNDLGVDNGSYKAALGSQGGLFILSLQAAI